MKEQFITVNGLRLHYLDWGNTTAPPLLLLHGGSAHSHWWDWFAPTVADRFHVIALDLRGHGDSEWAKPAAYDIEDYAADVIGFVQLLNLRPLRLIGHSLGGAVAAAAAGRIPEHVAALVIVDSWLGHDPERPQSGESTRFLHRLAQLQHPRYRTCEQGVSQYRLLPVGSSAAPEMLAHVGAHALRTTAEGTHWTLKFDRATLAAIKRYEVRPVLACLACPILTVGGGASRTMSGKAIAALREAIPQVEAVEIPGAHHHVMLDRPREFADLVGEFLQRTRDGGRQQ